jgi:hypothetical protein
MTSLKTSSEAAASEAATPDVAGPLEAVAASLRLHNIEAIVVDSGEAARETVLAMIPDGAEVHTGK